MISPYMPWPLYGGGSVRIFNIVKKLSERGHKIVLVAGGQDDLDLSVSPLKHLCEEIHLYKLPKQGRLLSLLRSVFSNRPYPALQFQSAELYKIVGNLLKSGHFDFIWINWLFMADILFKIPAINIPVILDQHEADELVWKKYIQNGNFIQKTFSYLNLRKIQFLQKKAFGHINAVLCVSEKEANFMRSKLPESAQVWVVPNGVDAEFLEPGNFSVKSEQVILMTGSMCITRNIDAAIWFAKSIFPKIKKNIPKAEFWIVGYEPDKKVLALKEIPGVTVTGTVEDMRSYYEKAKVYVAPFRFGEGTRLKILEAMAEGLPIVSTKEGFQGICAVDGKHVLIANNEDDFSDKVTELLHNKQLSQALGSASRILVEREYSWNKIADDLEVKLQKI